MAPGDLAACRALLRDGSRSFGLAARLLPREVARAATLLYAFCRVADDLIDGAPPGGMAAALAALRRRLDAVYAGCPRDFPEDRGLAWLVARYRIPRALPDALLEGFAWDAAGRRYRTLAELEAYGVRVAGSIGVMLCLLMGERRPVQLARACDLGIAMQLTNIARDVGADAALGRLYLPLDWLDEVGLDADAWLAAPRPDARLARLTRRLLGRADALYRQADAGVARLPAGCRVGIRAARWIYAAIGDVLREQGYDGVSRRAVVPAAGKLRLLAQAAAGGAAADARLWQAPPHEAAAPLIAAVTTAPGVAGARAGMSPALLSDPSHPSRWVRTAALFVRLDRATRTLTARGG